jgi:formylglycine-generating enzyme required for sulfatase activity
MTMRADFYHRCLEWPVLDALLAQGLYTLLAPKTGALHEMITRPAELAGLRFEDGLAERILDDTGMEPGALALMAFALNELWQKSQGADGVLTHAAYKSFNGVHGAIGKRAKDTFRSLEGKQTLLEAALGSVFRELVEVDERGTATRRRASLSQFTGEAMAEGLVNALTKERLLVTGRGEGHDTMVEVAHEAIFTSWPKFKAWIEATGDDLRLRRQVSQAAIEWDAQGQDKKYLWPDDRVVDVVGMLERLGLGTNKLSDSERRFLGPIDRGTMLTELETPDTSHEQRATIGVRLSLLGDMRPGVGLGANDLPDIAWREVPGGEITLEMERSGKLARFLGASRTKTRRVEPFYIGKYPVTWIQYRSFLEADDGFKDTAWWQGLFSQVEEEHRQFNQRDNHPVENLCWLEAVSFCRWLTAKLGYEVRLPTEWEWQQAATGGNPENEYPWGAWDSSYANTYESGLACSTAVGMHPHGVSPVGALDMSGNVWELCLNEYDNPFREEKTGEARRVLRGGSWDDSQFDSRTSSRFNILPRLRDYDVGFRLVCASPIF